MKISVIIPAYNAQKTIKKSLDSVLNQNFLKSEIEIIVINDGSTDNTLEILKRYGKKIKVISQKNKGPVVASNRGFKEAKGKYLIKIDADDYFKKGVLREMVLIMEDNNKLDFVYCNYYEKPERGTKKVVSTKNNIFKTLASGIMIKRESFKKMGFYSEKMKFPEYDLLLKTIGKWKGYHIDKPLFFYIRSKKSITGNKKWVKDAIMELKRKYPKKLDIIKKIRNY